jgi:ABC-type glycerol-3-phosphate transport system substrate-binding protein
MDTLSLIYNRDLLDQAGIATPPVTWREVLDAVSALRKTNAQGQLTASALALGGTDATVAHATDVLSLLMLQNGARMLEDGEAKFGNDKNAATALRFYSDFANPSSAAYTWNDSLGTSAESFAAGKTAMIVGYHGDLAPLKAKSPFLRLVAAPMPQVSADQNLNFPSYQALAVWRRSQLSAWAWDFIIFASTNADANRAYLKVLNRPPALRALVAALTNDPELGFYAKQSLTAASWEMPDYDKIKEIFSTAIQSVRGGETPDAALGAAADQVDQLFR